MPKDVKGPVKFHLGCGKIILPGYVNVDIQRFPGVDMVSDLRDLSCDDESADLIYSCANLEHFGRREWRGVLAHWYKKLKPGGTIRISTNDLEAACKRYRKAHNVEELLGLLIGGQKDDWDWHGMIFDFDTLKDGLEEVGFTNVRRYDWRKIDIGRMGIDDYSQAYLPHMDKDHGQLMMLNVEADKPAEKFPRKLNVAFYTNYKSWLGDNMFDLSSGANANNVFERYVALRDYLKERNIEFHTYDMYDNHRDVDVWFMMDPQRHMFDFILKNRINPRKVAPFLHEPPGSNPKAWRYLPWYSWMFKVIATWNTELCRKSPKFSHYYFPTSFDPGKYPTYKKRKKTNLCAMLHSNKEPGKPYPREQVTFRRNLIRYFEDRGDNLLDLYGPGWNDDSSPWPFHTDLYRGFTDNKRDTVADYYYHLCIDNSVEPGFITYDPLLSMAVGTVPVYLPMPDTHKYIPSDTYVSFNDFESFDDLVAYLKELVETGEYEAMRERGWKFLNSLNYWPFTVEQFCKDMYRVIRKAAV